MDQIKKMDFLHTRNIFHKKEQPDRHLQIHTHEVSKPLFTIYLITL